MFGYRYGGLETVVDVLECDLDVAVFAQPGEPLGWVAALAEQLKNTNMKIVQYDDTF